MLVLTRKRGEAIVIGENIRIVVTEIGQDRVRLGIDCPKDISVDREEVRERKQENSRCLR